jgi:hypothetical protein
LYKKILSGVIILALVVMIAVSTTPTTPITNLNEGTSQFVISSWEYPDEYGQGIDGIRFYENSTGAWVAAPYYLDIGEFYYFGYDTSEYSLNWSTGVGIKLRVYSVLNTTFIGINEGNITQGKNYQRHSVAVIPTNGTTIFSQQNFTYYDNEWAVGDLIFYEYEVILDFLPVAGEIYTVTVTYEVYGVWV